jgi:hypothetical protein
VPGRRQGQAITHMPLLAVQTKQEPQVRLLIINANFHLRKIFQYKAYFIRSLKSKPTTLITNWLLLKQINALKATTVSA